MTRRTSRVVIAVAAVLTIGAGGAAAAGYDAGLWDSEQPDDAGSDLPAATEEVTRQTLVDTQTESGELGYADSITVSGRLDGTVTALPAVGSVVERGQAIYRVDDTPVVLLYGPLPAYRPLAVDTEGADVRQFEENLSALGYGGFTVDEEYTSATAEAVVEWQEDLGLAETGTVELGRVVYAAGALRIDAHDASIGDSAGGGEGGAALLTCTSTARVITVQLDVADGRHAVDGAPVSVTLPDGGKAPGKIAGTVTVVEEAADERGEPTTSLEVVVTLDDPAVLDGLDAASLRVEFTTSQRENVLTVPVAALLALAEGGYGVEVVKGDTTSIVAVETGLFAAGRVEVSGEGLAEGMTVGMPS
jgi:peptidoglycan hydrolase-like protein with peptidoglycan-binding domain